MIRVSVHDMMLHLLDIDTNVLQILVVAFCLCVRGRHLLHKSLPPKYIPQMYSKLSGLIQRPRKRLSFKSITAYLESSSTGSRPGGRQWAQKVKPPDFCLGMLGRRLVASRRSPDGATGGKFKIQNLPNLQYTI